MQKGIKVETETSSIEKVPVGSFICFSKKNDQGELSWTVTGHIQQSYMMGTERYIELSDVTEVRNGKFEVNFSVTTKLTVVESQYDTVRWIRKKN